MHTINLYAYCSIEETDDYQITSNAYEAHLFPWLSVFLRLLKKVLGDG